MAQDERDEAGVPLPDHYYVDEAERVWDDETGEEVRCKSCGDQLTAQDYRFGGCGSCDAPLPLADDD